MQIGADNGHPGDVVGRSKGLVRVRLLLIDAEHERLQGGVAGLDEVARARRGISGQVLRARHDERVAAGSESASESRDVEKHVVTHTGGSDHLGVRQRAHRSGRSGDLDR